MLTTLIKTVFLDIAAQQIQNGECAVEFHFHDGRICWYTITSTKRRNTEIFYKEEKKNDKN
jgi:hypothetical protein